MLEIAFLENIIIDQAETFKSKKLGTLRDVDFKQYLKTKQITVISGIRRSGKSVLLKQFSKHYKNFYYLNFDDERLIDFSVTDFQNLMVAFRKQFETKVIFLDEIQNVPKWERFVRRLFEEGYKIFLTGSNAKLLSGELATHLTGRYLKIELYPFSFQEFLRFHDSSFLPKGTKQEVEIQKYFKQYLFGGGFPEFVKTKNAEISRQIFEDIVYRDLLSRFKIRETKNFKLLVNYLFTNVASQTSYNSLKILLNIKSATTVKNYIEFIGESYLAFELMKYDFSLKKQYVSNKKIYAIDNGLRNSVVFSFSEDIGKMLENMVFIELKRRGADIFYFKDKKECDFVIRKGLKITEAIQVTRSLADPKTAEREIVGLLEAMEKFKLKTGLIITESQEEEKVIAGKKIKIVPAWKWLLK
ncbi:MAG: ATP-binding protein [Candidatus Moraniibacteriota bacterium]